MVRNKTYLYDTSIAPLTLEEKKIMKQLEILRKKEDEIYKRTDKVIRQHQKEQRRLEKEKKEKERNDALRLLEENKKKMIKSFASKYKSFKKDFFKLSFEPGNENKIIKLRQRFSNKCIHPVIYKERGYYDDYIESSGHFSCYDFKVDTDGCSLCGINIIHTHTRKKKEFTDIDLQEQNHIVEKIKCRLSSE